MLALTKAAMLKDLYENVPSINILPAVVVMSDHFFQNTCETINAVLRFADRRKLIVRSSSRMEDLSEYSNAGKFESVLDVLPQYDEVKKAIERVYLSYHTEQNEEILIQPMLHDIIRSGVVLTADMDTFADYYIVNYYDGENTAAVTSGTMGTLKTYVQYKYSNQVLSDQMMDKLLDSCRLLEQYLNNRALDIEFAVSSDNTVYILQVRPIARGVKKEIVPLVISAALQRIYKKVKKLSSRHPFLLGRTTCFGVMPDWNPAEILGIRPKKLSISLYKELITDSVWAHQRYDYGYRDLAMHPLMISFCGIPYIDTRITFNSFIPQNLNEKIAEKLVNYYLDKLAAYPKYHDKVEFEIVFSCYYIGLPNKLKELLRHGFNENEITRIEFSLLELTNKIIDPENGLYKRDIRKISTLEENYQRIINSDISLVDQIYWLMEECKKYGTLPFAGVARAAFIAVQFLKSFVDIGIIHIKEYNAYMNSLDTINKRMNRDLKSYRRGEITKDKFLSIYGHIRPGTYDITSKRYDECFEEYFTGDAYLDLEEENENFFFSSEQLNRIQIELEQNGIEVTVGELLTFIREAIEGREYLKFIFTKVVSKILQLVAELGYRVGISKEDMAYIDISVIKQLYVDLYTGDVKTMFEDNIHKNKLQYRHALQIKLPSILVKPEDVYAFYLLEEEPNYITQKSITAETMVFSEQLETEIAGKVIFIQSADPGYDFIFSKNIAGLVTQFGGVNSHMAIRCAELGIPAVIGVGEKNYSEWSHYKCIMLDCLKKQIIRIQ